jgi:hypothetical protein
MNFDLLDKTEKKEETTFMYTEDQLMARLRFFIGICLALTLTGIVFVVLYSIIFVTQPLNAMSPIDQKFFELIIPIATFLTGTLSGIMLASKDDKEARMKAIEAATRPTTVSPNPVASPSVSAPKPFTPMPSTSFGGNTNQFTATPNAFTAPVSAGFGGKAAPPPAFEPEL